MTAKMIANGIQAYAVSTRHDLWLEVVAILKRRTTLDHSAIAALCWFKHVNI